jgi:hypothetical protein
MCGETKHTFGWLFTYIKKHKKRDHWQDHVGDGWNWLRIVSRVRIFKHKLLMVFFLSFSGRLFLGKEMKQKAKVMYKGNPDTLHRSLSTQGSQKYSRPTCVCDCVHTKLYDTRAPSLTVIHISFLTWSIYYHSVTVCRLRNWNTRFER